MKPLPEPQDSSICDSQTDSYARRHTALQDDTPARCKRVCQRERPKEGHGDSGGERSAGPKSPVAEQDVQLEVEHPFDLKEDPRKVSSPYDSIGPSAALC